jgi:TRAP-type C4-dicarboxylate transport system permease small subunit
VYAAIARFDEAIHDVEAQVVTAALLLMSGTVTLNIFYMFLMQQQANWRQFRAGDLAATALWPLPLIGVFAFFVARAAFARSVILEPLTEREARPFATAGAVVMTFGLALLSSLMLIPETILPSKTICVGLAVLIGLILLFRAWAAPFDHHVGKRQMLTRVAVALAITAGLMFYGSKVPAGYSWAPKLALFLLLWIAFIGASMATHQRRHIMVEAIKKAIPERAMFWFEGTSSLLAGLFTAAFALVAYKYFALRLAEPPTPAEIPDWLKVLAIPFALAMVTIRFIGQGIASYLAAAAGLKPPAPDATKVT